MSIHRGGERGSRLLPAGLFMRARCTRRHCSRFVKYGGIPKEERPPARNAGGPSRETAGSSPWGAGPWRHVTWRYRGGWEWEKVKQGDSSLCRCNTQRRAKSFTHRKHDNT